MKPREYYEGRPQTYLKHFFLERYLERVAYNIGSFSRDFCYIDCFSGPWRSEDEEYQDTSFMIAIEQLRKVKRGLAETGKQRRIRCLFIEKNRAAFRELQRATAQIEDVEITPVHGEFEQVIPDILQFVGTSFGFFFIDPTGWTGFRLEAIAPIIRHQPGEVLVNFMFDHINRFLEHPEPKVQGSLDELFAGSAWKEIKQSPDRESSLVSLYASRMKEVGHFDFATWTRVMKPLAERSYFYLVYGTRHPKGLKEFRGVERRFVEEQERIRLEAKQAERIRRTGQTELFPAGELAGPRSYEEQRQTNLIEAAEKLKERLKTRELDYDQALPSLLEVPLVWESDVKDLILRLREEGKLQIVGMKKGERKPKSGHRLRWVERSEE